MLENLAARIREDLYNDSNDWNNDDPNSAPFRLALITSAATLAHQGLLDNIGCVSLIEVDLRTVPTQHLVSLISNVTRSVLISYNVRGCDLLTLIDSVKKSEQLLIFGQCLGREETQALMRAMDSGLKRLVLYEVETRDVGGRRRVRRRGWRKDAWKRALVNYSRLMKCRLEIW